jgi:hypothetical protein
MAGGYQQLGYAKYYRIWNRLTGTIRDTSEGHEVSLIFVPLDTVVPSTVTEFRLVGYTADPANPCAALVGSKFTVKTIVECDDPPGTVSADAIIRIGGTGNPQPVAGIGCEFSIPCWPMFVNLEAVSGEHAKYDVFLRVGRLKRARF